MPANEAASLEELKTLEEKAVRLEKLANLLLDTPQQAFYVYSYQEGRFLIGHEHVSGLYGYAAGEIEALPDGWFSIIHPDDVNAFRAMHEQMMTSKGDEVHAMQLRVIRKDQGVEWVDVHKRVFERNAKGGVASEVGMAVIITPLKEAEAALRGTQALYHDLFQNNTAGVLSFDCSFRIRDANPMMCRMLKQKQGALLRLSLQDVLAPGSRSAVESMLAGLKAGRKVPTSFETCLEAGDGSRLEVLASISCLRGKDDVMRCMLIFTDLTARKEIEEAWRRELELNKVLIDHAPISIGLLDAHAKLLRVNQAAEELFGFRSKEVIGRQLWDIPVLGDGEVGPSQKRFQALLQGETKVEAFITMRAKNGEPRFVATATTAVRKPDGKIDFLVTTGTDVTERKRLEAEVIRVAEQEHIRIGADLHDGVGQTLTGVAALTEALIQQLDGGARADAERIYDLLKTAQEETRRLSHGLSPAAVKNRGLADGLRLVAETVRLNFRRECECHLDESIRTAGSEADTHLFRIAQEAVNNALRHGGANRIRLSLRKHNDSSALLEISDDGRGFSTGKKAARNPSAGIGLRVMEYRANLLGGQLKVHAQPKRGVRVTCYFPTTLLKDQKLTKP